LAESAAMAAAFEFSDLRIGFWPELETGFRNNKLTFRLKLACLREEKQLFLSLDFLTQ
jgi:hypothetical protein